MSQVQVHICLQPYYILPCYYPLHIILFVHLMSTNHKCTQPCHFPLLIKPATQKEKMEWNSSTRSSRLCVTLVVVLVVLWSLAMFYFA
jgi:hypothetical protein